ncbi:MAG TPA: prolyl oligopeptidase family serine peptidase [Clostridia bacterium]|nr:prolyl oligopeptidase family serine peptidase [Clostridia bacterium]
MDLRHGIAKAIGIEIADVPDKIAYEVTETSREAGYTRQRIAYESAGDTVAAYLLLPEKLGKNPAALVHHQHNGERHLGKSEVCGLAGNPLQAFGPTLAQSGFVVLAPDSVCFEERRENGHGITPLPNGDDFLQHFNAMCYRILKGGNLMQKVLFDAMYGVSLLAGLPYVDTQRIGTLGHSYGGNTVLFLTALDTRIGFACASGSACTYNNRMQNGIGIEMASVIPGFSGKYEIDDLVRCIAPRRLLIVSAEEDKYSRDADFIVEKARPSYTVYDAENDLRHKRYSGGHALTQERFDFIVDWMCKSAGRG